VRVPVVDDQQPFRDAATRVVDATEPFVVVGVAPGEEALAAAGRLHPASALPERHGVAGLQGPSQRGTTRRCRGVPVGRRGAEREQQRVPARVVAARPHRSSRVGPPHHQERFLSRRLPVAEEAWPARVTPGLTSTSAAAARAGPCGCPPGRVSCPVVSAGPASGAHHRAQRDSPGTARLQARGPHLERGAMRAEVSSGDAVTGVRALQGDCHGPRLSRSVAVP
jgi:hypothetical protein